MFNLKPDLTGDKPWHSRKNINFFLTFALKKKDLLSKGEGCAIISLRIGPSLCQMCSARVEHKGLREERYLENRMKRKINYHHQGIVVSPRPQGGLAEMLPTCRVSK